MGFVGSLFNSGQGSGFQGATSSNAIANASQQQQAAYGQQQAFLQALQTGQNSIQNQQNVFNEQQGLANTLQQESQGQGPNLAMAQLAQTTGQNMQNQASLMAGQRGVQNNPGLASRQIAQQGAAQQQNAVGQAASMQAQQQLAYQQQLQAQQGQMASLANTQVGEQQAAIEGMNQTAMGNQGQQLGFQQGLNSTNAQIAGINAQGQQQIAGGILGGAGIGLGLAKGGIVPHYAMGSMIDTNTLPGAQQIPQANQYSLTDTQLPQSLGGPMVAPQANKYSLMDNSNPLTNIQAPTDPGPKSSLGKMSNGFNNAFNSKSPLASGMSQLTSGLVSGAGNAIKSAVSSNPDSSTSSNDDYSTGGKVPAKVSPGEKYLKPYEAKEVAEGKVNPKNVGEKIPGHAKVKGDSPKNDTVSKDLIPGGVIVPRSKVKDPEKLTRFVNAIMGMHKVGG